MSSPRHYTVRYRERHRKWNYQTCPTSDTVIDNLKPNTAYEFGVQPNGPDRPGTWSKPVIHNTNIGGMQPQLSHINIVGFVVRRKENQNNFCLFVQAIHKQSLSHSLYESQLLVLILTEEMFEMSCFSLIPLLPVSSTTLTFFCIVISRQTYPETLQTPSSEAYGMCCFEMGKKVN
jgi:hypothetical protein